MQTFLPVPDFEQSAHILDWRRLGKQRVEARQILNALKSPNRWSRHPAVLMWAGYENALIEYGNRMIIEWAIRGYQNNMSLCLAESISLPPWFGDELFHASHRSNLLRKDPIYYSRFGWKEDSHMAYFWPRR